jgi:hypothetical protein
MAEGVPIFERLKWVQVVAGPHKRYEAEGEGWAAVVWEGSAELRGIDDDGEEWRAWWAPAKPVSVTTLKGYVRRHLIKRGLLEQARIKSG